MLFELGPNFNKAGIVQALVVLDANPAYVLWLQPSIGRWMTCSFPGSSRKPAARHLHPERRYAISRNPQVSACFFIDDEEDRTGALSEGPRKLGQASMNRTGGILTIPNSTLPVLSLFVALPGDLHPAFRLPFDFPRR